jgi:predicted enzyme related to lactoylglutathione lyase
LAIGVHWCFHFASANGEANLSHDLGFFTWYELITTDMPAAATFYREAVGLGTTAAPAAAMRYEFFTAGDSPIAGLMELPEEGRKMGATPRWMGYVSVGDVDGATDKIKRLGGTIYVPPTDTNIGRISVVTDSSLANFGVVNGLPVTRLSPADGGKPGRVGWHELFAADLKKQVAFYRDMFGWQPADTENHFIERYVSLASGGQVIAGAFDKGPSEADPFWLFYFNVADLDEAAERVKTCGGRVSVNDDELPGGSWVAHCTDPQGAAFGLQGKRGHGAKVGWSTEWQGFSSRGQLVAPKPGKNFRE